MLRKKDRTLNRYKVVGAEARLIKTLFAKFQIDCSAILPVSITVKLDVARRALDRAVSDAEDCMFKDYPKLDRTYINVFYGDIDAEKISDVDKEIVNIAITIMKNLIDGADGAKEVI